MKKKITELEKIVETSRREKNTFGKYERIKKKIRVKHTINEPGVDVRAFHYFFDYFIVKLITYCILLIFFHYEKTTIFDFFFVLQNEPLLIYVYIIYYLVLEFFFQKSIAKFITKTIIVDEFGNKPNFINILFRTLSRVTLPFDSLVLVLFKRSIHDYAGNTFVLHKDSLAVIKKLQENELNKI